jgi:hypothetical protein
MTDQKQLIVAIVDELKSGFFLTLQEKCKIDYQKICDIWDKYFEINYSASTITSSRHTGNPQDPSMSVGFSDQKCIKNNDKNNDKNNNKNNDKNNNKNNDKNNKNEEETSYLDYIRFIHNNEKNKWSKEACIETACVEAAKNGYLNCLKYIHENGYEWTKETCTEAASNGHLDCLMYAHENGCEWTSQTCTEAASNGHLNCLMYAHENGCVLSKETSYKASTVECFQFIEKNWIYQNNNKIEEKFKCDEFDCDEFDCDEFDCDEFKCDDEE